MTPEELIRIKAITSEADELQRNAKFCRESATQVRNAVALLLDGSSIRTFVENRNDGCCSKTSLRASSADTKSIAEKFKPLIERAFIERAEAYEAQFSRLEIETP